VPSLDLAIRRGDRKTGRFVQMSRRGSFDVCTLFLIPRFSIGESPQIPNSSLHGSIRAGVRGEGHRYRCGGAAYDYEGSVEEDVLRYRALAAQLRRPGPARAA